MCFIPANQPRSGTALPAAPADTRQSTQHPGVRVTSGPSCCLWLLQSQCLESGCFSRSAGNDLNSQLHHMLTGDTRRIQTQGDFPDKTGSARRGNGLSRKEPKMRVGDVYRWSSPSEIPWLCYWVSPEPISKGEQKSFNLFLIHS